VISEPAALTILGLAKDFKIIRMDRRGKFGGPYLPITVMLPAPLAGCSSILEFFRRDISAEEMESLDVVTGNPFHRSEGDIPDATSRAVMVYDHRNHPYFPPTGPPRYHPAAPHTRG
jgi:hypothetical protein